MKGYAIFLSLHIFGGFDPGRTPMEVPKESYNISLYKLCELSKIEIDIPIFLKNLTQKFSKNAILVKGYRKLLSRAISQFLASIVFNRNEIGHFRQFASYRV